MKGKIMKTKIKYIIGTMFVLFSSFLYALEVGSTISNTASIDYTYANAPLERKSNSVEDTIEASEAKISFVYATEGGTQTAVLGASAYIDANGVWHEGEVATLGNGEILGDGSSLNLEDTDYYRQKDVAIVTVIDADQNVNRDVREVIEVNITNQSGDVETLQLQETTPNSGTFVAYIKLTDQYGVSHDNQLSTTLNENIVVGYDDITDVKTDAAIILEKKDFNVWIEKQVNKTEASIGELLEYRLVVHNDEEFAITDFLITDSLPLGLKYEEGTAHYGKEKITAIRSDDGKKIKFKLPRVEANSQVEVTFIASVTAGVHNAKVSNEAWVTKSTVFKSNVATVTTKINEELMRSKGIIVGQIYNETNSTLGVAGVRLYLENGMYVVTDQQGKYHFSGVNAGRHIVQVDKGLLPQGYAMGTCKQSTRKAGRNFSELVNLGKGALKRVDFCLKRDSKKVEVTKELDKVALATEVETMPDYGVKALNSNEKRAILWPPKAYVPSMLSTRIAIKHPKSERVEIWLNAEKVSQLNYEGNVASKKSTNVIDLYKGVDLLERTNTLKVNYFSSKGELLETLKRKVYVSSSPVQVEYVKKHSTTLADGKHSPVIAVRFLDDAGKPLRSGMTGTFSVEAPYASQNLLDQIQNNPLTSTAQESRYTIDSNGIAYIKLQPTTQSGEVTLHFQLQERDEVIRAWLKPALREWIMVGFAEGTVGYNTLSGNKESLKEIDAQDKVITEGRVSFFAKGRIKGDWLLSMAYDTGKDSSKKEFFDEIDPNAYYTLYNDNSIQNQEASSRKKLYVKLEKEQFNILFGDYSTDLSYTQLSAYSRRFTGLKSEYHGDNISAKAFVSQTEQLFMKDEIRGDGTSGYYYLKSKKIVHFSEKITIEVRDRYRLQDIVSTRSLQRFRDYEIDYAQGRVYFKEPIYSNDEKFNPRFIVVDYEVEGDGGTHYTYGGRVAVKGLNDKVEVGGTYISEDSGKKHSQLMGTDTTLHIGKSTRFKAEYARSKTTQETVSTQGEAKLAELEYVEDGLYARAYYREQESAFGLGQLSASLASTRKVGVDVTQQFDNRFKQKAKLYRDTNLLEKTNSDVLDFRMEFDNLTWSAFAGYRYSKLSTDAQEAQQLLLGGAYSLFDQRLRLSLLREQTISQNENKLFPSKTTLGLDYALTGSMDFFSAYEWSKDLEQGRVGIRVRPWSGMSVENTVVSEFKNDQQNLYNTLGGMQTFQVNDKLSVNIGYEKGKALGKTQEENLTTSLSGNDFDAYRVGLSYNNKSYTATLNTELRKSKEEEKVNLSTAIYTQTSNDLALALSGSLNKDENNQQKRSDANMRFSMAYRPEEDGMMVLEKLDFIRSELNDETGSFLTDKMVNNINVNLQPTRKSELALQYGFKYVVDSIDAFEKKGVTQLFGIDTHYDITPTWELGVQGSLLYAQSANNMDYGFGLYSGHNLFDNMVLTLGYNWQGFEDRDFALQTYRMEGAYFRFNMKFDQESLKDTVRLMSW